MANKRVTSTDIKIALSKLHSNKSTYFFTECKTCSTYFPDPQGLLKFDGLAVTKSYTKPNIIGYEIKVSRNDFKQDNKWHLYLQYCNEFYFVVPAGLVTKDELPDNVGLIYYNADTKALRKVKRAQYRMIDKPVGVYEYIIFSRLEEDRLPFYNDRKEYCKDYLNDKVNRKYVGDRLGTKLAMDLQEAHKRLDEVEHSESELELWKAVKKVLKDRDIVGYWRNDKETVVSRLKDALSGAFPSELPTVINGLEYNLKTLKKLQEKHKKDD